MTHLWEIDHPYYAAEGNFYARPDQECHTTYESWGEFTETTFYDGDRDLNLLYRWDWRSPRRDPDPLMASDEDDYLLLFFILQRKAIACSAHITVTDEDEPAVRKWLETCAATIGAIWEPIAVAPTDEAREK